MRSFKIDVNISPFNIRQALKLHLQFFGNIMTNAESLVWVHDDIDFDDQPWARMPGADSIDLLDAFTVCHADIGDELLSFSVGGNANEELEFRVCSSQPEASDEDGEDNGTSRVKPPSQLGTADRGQNTKPVDEKIIAMILPQNADLGILVAQSPTVEEEGEFGAKGNADGND